MLIIAIMILSGAQTVRFLSALLNTKRSIWVSFWYGFELLVLAWLLNQLM